jgi:hypothetical protein
VYVDLMRLPYDAGPWDFFTMLRQCALDVCQAGVPGYRSAKQQCAVRSLDDFEKRWSEFAVVQAESTSGLHSCSMKASE